MWFISLLMLVLLGLLGIASRLRQRVPAAAGPLTQLEGVGGWIGLVGLIWGIWSLVLWISAIGFLSSAPLMMITGLLSTLVIIALSLILAIPVIKSLAGKGGFSSTLEQSAAKLEPFKNILGAVCLALAALTLITRVI
mgnify:CR=1 FL=1